MFKGNNKWLLLFAGIFALLLIIQPCFAGDNQTLLNGADLPEMTVSSHDSDLLAGSNDYYFDASLENDSGDGSAENPYKYLTSSRIKAYSNIHLANGEYDLDSVVEIERVNIIGQNSTQTIIRYDGVAFNVRNALALTNLTLVGLTIQNYASLNVTNCIFTGGLGSEMDDYGHTYGGAIYKYKCHHHQLIFF